MPRKNIRDLEEEIRLLRKEVRKLKKEVCFWKDKAKTPEEEEALDYHRGIMRDSSSSIRDFEE